MREGHGSRELHEVETWGAKSRALQAEGALSEGGAAWRREGVVRGGGLA